MRRKSRGLAALLNLLLPGVGYLYVGRRVGFAALLFIGVLLGTAEAYSDDGAISGLEAVGGIIIALPLLSTDGAKLIGATRVRLASGSPNYGQRAGRLPGDMRSAGQDTERERNYDKGVDNRNERAYRRGSAAAS